MFMTVHGSCPRPAVATLSTWDPFLKESAAFAKVMATYAHRRDLSAAAVLIAPTPAAVVNGEATWPYFQDVATRVQLLLDCGVDAVCVLDFAKPDLAAGAHEFFELVSSRCTMAEFWLRNRQSIGSGAGGSATAVRGECAERECKLRFIRRFTADVGVATRAALVAGSVRRATLVARTLPTYRRPASGVATFAWHPGEYRVLAAGAPDTDIGRGEEFTVTLAPAAGGLSALEWPDPAIEYLRFTAGPADLADAGAGVRAPRLAEAVA